MRAAGTGNDAVRLRWLPAVAALLLCGLLSGRGWARSITIEDFDVAIDVATDGALAVTETIRLRFEGQWNGIHRLIPVEYRTPGGAAYRLRLSLDGVSDSDGRPLRVERSREGLAADLKIFVPGASDASRTIVIRYTVGRGLRFFDDHDELYWNVTGDEWPYPIAAARARISLPGAAVNVRVNAFTGGFGSRERAVEIVLDGRRQAPDDVVLPAGESPPPAGGRHVIDVAAARPLGIREGLSVAVAWNPGAVRRPTALGSWLGWLRDNLPTFALAFGLASLPLVAFVVMLRRWLREGRDPRPGPLVVHYEPPADLGPAEVGTLVDNAPDTRDLMAALVDCAVKGIIRIRETQPAGWFSGAQYAFDLLVPEADWRGVTPAEARILRGMFPLTSGRMADPPDAVSTVRTADLTESFYTHLPGIKTAIFDRLVAAGHYAKRPDRVRAGYVGAAVGLGILIVVVSHLATILATGLWGSDPLSFLGLAVAAGLLTAAVIAAFGLVMPARTRKGVDTRMAILGFEEFLTRVEKHRLASLPLTPELFERYLPYAIALGVESRWAQAFESICSEPPRWYVGTGTGTQFHAGDLTQGLGRMTAVTTAAMQSAPRSSGGSGFGGGGSGGGGGGGFSGGGFGGGGGHGF